MTRSLLTLSVLLATFGCNKVKISDVEAEVSPDIPTVVTVRWTTNTETVGYVAFGPQGDLSLQTHTELEPATEHELHLVGLTANTEAEYQVVVVEEDGETTSEVESVTTGNLPSGLPGLTVTGSGMEHYMVLPVLGSPVGLVILDPEGNFLWWHWEDRGLDVYRAILSNDGQSVLYNAASVSGDPSEESQIMRVSMDGGTVEGIDVPLLAHEFVELPDGTITAMVVHYEGEGEDEIKGDSLVEIAPDGTQTTIWTSWDCFDPEEHVGDDQDYGWTFANSLDYDPDLDCYYLSLRNFSTVVQIFRDGSCGWAFGDVGATIEASSGADRFIHSHQFEVLEDSFLVFDNDGSSENMVSRVLEFDFDPTATTADKIWEYTADPAVFSFVLGDVHRFDDGDTLVTWSVNGLIERVDGDLPEWSVQADFGHAFGFNTVREDLYAADDNL